MKRTVMIALLASLALASCKKEYYCFCEDGTLKNGNLVLGVEETTIIEKSSKKKAAKTCDDKERDVESTDPNFEYYSRCSILD